MSKDTDVHGGQDPLSGANPINEDWVATGLGLALLGVALWGLIPAGAVDAAVVAAALIGAGLVGVIATTRGED